MRGDRLRRHARRRRARVLTVPLAAAVIVASSLSALVVGPLAHPTAASGAAPGLLAPGTIVYSTPPTGGQVDGTIVTLAPGSSSPTVLTTGDQVHLSSNGASIAFFRGSGSAGTGATERNLWVRDLATGTETEVLANAGSIDGFSFDTTGSFLYFDTANAAGTVCGWSEVSVFGGPATSLPGPAICGDQGPVVLPGTDETLWGHNVQTGLVSVGEVGPGAGSATTVAGTGSGADALAASPDGATVAYVEDFPGQTDTGNLATVPTNQSAPPTALTSFIASSGDRVTGSPVWSPDAKEVLAIATVGGTPGVWAFRPGAVPALVSAVPSGADTLGGLVSDQVEVAEPFTASTANDPNWTSGGTAFSPCLTAGADVNQTPLAGCAGNPDTTGSGTLRLTDSGTGEAGDVIYNQALPFAGGLVASFNAAQWGGTGGDGMSFFLLNGSTQVDQFGAPGGGLGYAAEPANSQPGIDGGYLGIGLDAYGDFTSTQGGKDPTANCAGEPSYATRQFNSLAIRGSGSGESGYCLLGALPEMDYTQHDLRGGGATRAAATRSVTVTIPPADAPAAQQDVTVVVGFGAGVAPETLSAPLPTPRPASIKFGFGASSGGVDDIHEVSHVVVGTDVQAQSAGPVLDLSLSAASIAAGSSGAVNANVAIDPSGARESEPVQTSVSLPSGLTLASAPSSNGWACPNAAAGATIVTCTSLTGVESPGSALPPLSVPVTVDASASGALSLTATAASGDAAPVSATAALNVTAANTGGGSGPGGGGGTSAPAYPTVTLSGPPSMAMGGTAQMTAVVNGNTDGWPTGSGPPHDVVFTLAPGATSGQALAASGTGTGWTCTEEPASVQTNLMVCSSSSSVAPGASSNPITLNLTTPTNHFQPIVVARLAPVASPPPSAALETVTAQLGGRTETVAQEIDVLTNDSPVLSVALSPPGAVVAGGSSNGSLVVNNTGPGSTESALTVTFTAPNAPTGTVVSAVGGNEWSCTNNTCTDESSIAPAGSSTALTYSVTAPGQAKGGGAAPAPINLDVTATTAGPNGTVTNAATATVPVRTIGQAALVDQRTAVTANPDGTLSYTLDILNQGTAATSSGPVTFTEQLPPGVTATWTDPSGNNTCSQSGSLLTCTESSPGLVPGSTSDAVQVTLDDSDQYGGNFDIADTASAGSGTAKVYTTDERTASFVSTKGVGPALSQSTSPIPTLTVTADHVPLSIEQIAGLNISFGTSPPTMPTVFGIVLPPTALESSQDASGLSQGKTGCDPTKVSIPDGAPAVALVCLDPDPATDPAPSVTMTLQGSETGQVNVLGGIVTGSGSGTLAQMLSAGLSKVNQYGISAMEGSGQSFLDSLGPQSFPFTVTGFTPVAAPATSTVSGTTRNVSGETSYGTGSNTLGSEAPTPVTLDASQSLISPEPLTYAWCQVSGPSVTWTGENAPSAIGTTNQDNPTVNTGIPNFPSTVSHQPCYSLGAPVAYGQHPTFLAPQSSGQTQVVFNLVMTDGNTEASSHPTTITVKPTPGGGIPPTLSGVQVDQPAVGLFGMPTPLAPGSTPTGGEPLCVVENASALDGDTVALSYSWSTAPWQTQPAFVVGSANCHGGAGFTWPAVDPPYGKVSVVATDVASGLQTSQMATIGTPPAGLTVSVAVPSTPQPAGSTLQLTATTTGGSGTPQIAWSSANCSCTPQSGSTMSFTVPASAAVGQSLTFTVTAHTGTAPNDQTATDTVTVPIGPATPLTVDFAPASPLASSTSAQTVNLDASNAVTGGAGGDTYQWSASSQGLASPATLSSTTVSAPVLTVPPSSSPGQVVITLTVTDGAGTKATGSESIVYGAGVGSGSGTPATSCSALVSSLTSNPNLHLSGLSADLGSIANTACGSGSGPSFSGATLSGLAGKLSGTGLGGSILGAISGGTPDEITFNSGSLNLPASWKLPAIPLGAGNSFSYNLDTSKLTGSLKLNGLPFIHTPSFLSSAPTTITFNGSVITVSATDSPTAGGTVTVAGTIDLSGSGADPGTCPTTGNSPPAGCVLVTVSKLALLGGTFNGTGTVDLFSSPPKFTLDATDTDTFSPVSGVTFTSGAIDWDGDNLTVCGTGALGSSTSSSSQLSGVLIAGCGDYESSDSWSLQAAAWAPPGGWSPIGGTHKLTIPAPTWPTGGAINPGMKATDLDAALDRDCGTPQVTNTLCGTVSEDADNSDPQFTVNGDLGSLNWTPAGQSFALNSLDVEVSNGDEPGSGSCGTLDMDAGDVFIDVLGSATVTLPGAHKISNVKADVCVDPSAGNWALSSSVPTSTFQPFGPSVPITLNGVSLDADDVDGDFVADLNGSASVKGITCSGEASIDAPDGTDLSDGDTVLDASCPSLAGAGLPSIPGLNLGSGHLIYGTSGGSSSGDQWWYLPDLGGGGIGSGAGSSFNIGFGSLGLGSCLGTGHQASGGGSCIDLGSLSATGALTAVTGGSMPGALSGFISNNLAKGQGLTLPNLLTLQGTLGDGDISITAALNLGGLPGGGIKVFGNGTNTTLSLQQVSVDFDESGSIDLAAAANLHLPGGGGTGANASQPTDLGLVAALTVDTEGPSVTVSLALTGSNTTCTDVNSDGSTNTTTGTNLWCGAAGVSGLDLQDVAIQGGISFDGPPTPSIGFGATIDHLPCGVAKVLGIQEGCPGQVGPTKTEPMTFVLNISAANPIFELSLGTACDPNAQTGSAKACDYFIKPLESVFPNNPSEWSALQIAQASVIIAPDGGTVGPYTVAPGFSLQFISQVGGVDVDVSASVDVEDFSISASAHVGAISLPVGTLEATTLQLDIGAGAGGLYLDFKGGLVFNASSGTSAPGTTQLSADLTIVSKPAGGDLLSASLKASASNFVITPYLTLNQFSLVGQVGFTDGAIPNISVTATAQATILGTPVQIAGSLTFGPLGLQSGYLEAGVGNMSIVPGVQLTGSGCPAVTQPSPIPATGNGACVTLGFNLADPQDPLDLSVSGDLNAFGFDVNFTGSLSNTGLDIKNAGVTVPLLGSISVQGALYFGSGLSSTTVTSLRTNSTCTPSAGDFQLATQAMVNGLSFAGIAAKSDVSVGSLCGQQWLHADANLDALGSNVDISGDFAFVNDQLQYDLKGSSSINFAGYNIANCAVEFSNAGLSISGALNLGILKASINGNVSEGSDGLHYSLTGAAAVNLGFVSSSGTITISDTNGVDAYLTASVGPLTATGHASVDPATGSFSLSGSGSAEIAGVGLTFEAAVCEGSSCNPSGFSATLSAFGYTFSAAIQSANIDINYNTGTQSIQGCVSKLCASFSYYVNIGVSLNLSGLNLPSVTFVGNASVATWCNCGGGISGPSFSVTYDGASRSISVNVGISIFSKTVTVTY